MEITTKIEPDKHDQSQDLFAVFLIFLYEFCCFTVYF